MQSVFSFKKIFQIRIDVFIHYETFRLQHNFSSMYILSSRIPPPPSRLFLLLAYFFLEIIFPTIYFPCRVFFAQHVPPTKFYSSPEHVSLLSLSLPIIFPSVDHFFEVFVLLRHCSI